MNEAMTQILNAATPILCLLITAGGAYLVAQGYQNRIEFLCPLSGKRRKGDNDDFQNVGVHKGIFSL